MERPRRRREACAAALLLLLPLSVAIDARCQDVLRTFGPPRYDTGALAAPVAEVMLRGSVLGVRRIDDRIMFLGWSWLQEAPTPPAGLQYVTFSFGGGLFSECAAAVRSDGQLITWTTVDWEPVPTLPANVLYIDVSVAQENYAVALRSDGVAVTWGRPGISRPPLPTVPAGATILQAHAAISRIILLLSNGTIVEAGVGGGWPTNVPPLPAGMTYVQLWAGQRHAFARRSDGAVLGWGSNVYGQATLPAPPAGVDYTTLSLGDSHTIATRSDGAFVGVGSNQFGQLALPDVPPGQTVAAVACGEGATVLLLSNGEVAAHSDQLWWLAQSPPAGQSWVDHSGPTVLTSAGELDRLWNWYGPPTPALPAGQTWVDVADGLGHLVGLRSDGNAIAWGNNSQLQLAIPPLPPGTTYTWVGASTQRTLLMRSDGQAVECGNFGVATIPPPPPGLTYVAVDGDDDGTMLLRSDGTIDVIGGQSPDQPNVPPLPPRRRYVAVSMQRLWCAAIRSDGELLVWGSTNPPQPPPLPAGVSYVEVTGGGESLFARRSDGTAVQLQIGPFHQLSPPTVLPGEAIVGLSAIEGTTGAAARIGPPTSYVTFAPGCAGTLPPSRIVPRDTPRIGRTLELHVLDLPHDLALLVSGWNTTAPLSLAPLGMPGCDQHITFDAADVVVGAGGAATVTFDVPDAPALVGATFAQQALVLDLAANPAGFVVSDATVARIGRP